MYGLSNFIVKVLTLLHNIIQDVYLLWWNQRVFHRRDARHALLEELSHAEKMRPLRSGRYTLFSFSGSPRNLMMHSIGIVRIRISDPRSLGSDRTLMEPTNPPRERIHRFFWCVPWFERSRITHPNPDYLKGTPPFVLRIFKLWEVAALKCLEIVWDIKCVL